MAALTRLAAVVSGIFPSKVVQRHCLRLLSGEFKTVFLSSRSQICPGLNANEIQMPYDKYHKVSPVVKSNQNTHNSVKYEVLIKLFDSWLQS